MSSYWLPRSAIGYIEARQKNYFGVAFKQHHFDYEMLYKMVMEKETYDSEYWLGLAKAAVDEENVQKEHQRNARRTNRSSGEAGTDDEAHWDASHLEESEDEQRNRKRARATVSSRITRSTTIPARPLPILPGMVSPVSMVTGRSSTAATMDSNEDGVKVKPEGGEESGGDDMITVYVGMQNVVFKISKEDLSQSPVLSGYMRGKPFIMDPDLMEVASPLFESVDEFLKTAEFQPLYVPKEGRSDFEPGAGSLDGVDGHKDYSTELLRLGELYVLAGKFGLPKMQLLIRRKIVAGFAEGWSYKTMLVLVGKIFRDMPGTVENAAAAATAVSDRDGGEGEVAEPKEPLKDWLIRWLAQYMREYTQSLEKGVPQQYWDTLDKGVGLSLAVHRVKAQIIEKHKGELVKIEDDETSDA